MKKTLSIRIPKEMYEKLHSVIALRIQKAIQNNQAYKGINLSNLIRDEFILPLIEKECA